MLKINKKIPLCDITSDPSISGDLEKNIDNIGLDLKKMRRSQRQHEKPQVTYSEIEEKDEENKGDEENKEDEENEKEEDEAIERKKPKLEMNTEENMETYELSEYEKMVQKNRQERDAFLRSLKIDEVKEEFNEIVKSITPKRTPKILKRPTTTQTLPTRKSKRLAKIEVNLSEKALYAKAITEAAQEQEAEETKLLPPTSYPLDEAITVKEEYADFLNDYIFDTKENAKHEPCISQFEQMKLMKSGVAKVVPVRISALTVHPSTDKIIAVAGSKRGHIGFWSVISNSNPVVFTPHIGGVTGLKTNPYAHHQIFSSSYDGTVRCGDMEKKVFQLMFDVSEETCCTYFDFISLTTFLVGLRNGFVSVVDSRIESMNNEKRHKCHESPVKTVSVHPVNKSLFLTASTKGEMKLWDLRKLQKQAVIDISHHTRCVSSAFFSPISGNTIISTSADDSLGIFDCSNLEKEILFKRKIKHNNWTGRWLTPFKANWIPFSDDYFVMGCLEQPRGIEVFNAKGDKVFKIKDEDFCSVTSLNEFHQTLNVLAGGNSSGKVYVFKDTNLKF